MNIDANRLAKDFGIFDPSILREEDKAQQRRFPTPKEFVDAAPGVEDFDALGKAYASMYEDYATKALGMNPGLAKARSLSVQQVFFNGMDSAGFNSTWEGVLNPQKQQAEVQQQQQLEKRQNVSLLDTATQGYSDMKAAEMLNLNRQYQEAIPKLEQDVKDAGPMTRWLYDATLEDSKKSLQETQDWLAQYEADKKNRAVNPTLEKIQQAKTFGDAASAVWEHPIDAITYGAASSAIPSALMLGNAYLGNRVGGSSSAMTAMGTSSADMEYKSGVMEALSAAGVNVSDRQALDKALKNPELMRKIDLQAGQKAAVVGALDAASLGVAGKLFPSSPIKSTLANAVAQPALGAGGEALGSVYSGQEIKPGAVVLEALGELPSSFVETAMMRKGDKPAPQRDATIDTTTVIPQPIQPIQPNANPLSQFVQKPQTATQTNSPPEQPNGLDMNAVVDRMIGAESAGKADAKNPLSSAEGLGQFIDSTWLAMVKKHRPDIASGKSDDAILALKTNGALSREMTTRYAEDNLAELQASGFEATGRNVYLAHHFGVEGASSLLKADPNSPVSTVVSEKVIQQNPYMKGKSVGEVLNVISNKMGEQAGAVSANNTGSQSVRTSEGFQNTATEPTVQENSQTTPANTPEAQVGSSTPAIDSEPSPTATVSPTITEANQAIDTAGSVANTETVAVNPPPTLDEANRAQAVRDNPQSQIIPSTEMSSTPATPNSRSNTPDVPSRTVIPSVEIPEVNPSQAPSTQGLPNTANTTEQSSTANPQNIAAQVTTPPADNTPLASSELAPVSAIDIGKKGVISDENNQEQAVDFQVVDVADLSLPDDNSSKPKRKGAKRAVDSIIQKPVYARLNMQHSILDEGAPVLRSDNTIVAGNQRILGLKGAYAAGRASQYKKSLMADLKAQGVDTVAISQMKAPVLVRRVQDGVAGAQANSAPVAKSIPSTASNATGATDLPSSSSSVKNEQISTGIANQASSNPLYNISPRQANLTGNDTKLTTAWKLIASQDDAFQLPISNKNTLGEIAADYDPAFKVRLLEDTKQKRQWVIDVPSKKGRTPVFVTEGKGKNKAIYIDISNFEPGEGGRTIYQMIGDYAHNTGKVFIGDPNGLSAIAQIRRTENMLSSALRWGTTDHLQPHELQLKPDSSKVTPLQWKVGNSEFNIDQMLRASMGNLLNQIPELGKIRYNFESQQFEETLPNGKVDTVTETDFRELAKSRGARAAQAGSATLKRAVISASILSGAGQEGWNGILGSLVRQSGQQLDSPLKRILYGLDSSLDQVIHQVAADKQLSSLAEDALLSVFGESPKNQAIADRLLRQFFFDNFVQSETYPDSRSFVTARMNELRSSGALKLISDQYFSGNSVFKLKDDASRKPISAEKAEAAIRRILGDIPFETTIPDEIRSNAGDAAERVKGAFANGKIYIDTSNIGSIAEAEALAIEELVHRGVANLFGPDYDARLMALHEAIGGEAGIRRFISQHKIEMADDYFNQSPQAQMDELLAHIEANQSTLTVRVKRAFQRLIAHLRNAIRKFNTKVLHNVSDSDIILIARNARNAANNSVSNPSANTRFHLDPEQAAAAHDLSNIKRLHDQRKRRSGRLGRYLKTEYQTWGDRKAAVSASLFKSESAERLSVVRWTKRHLFSDSFLGRDVADAKRGLDWDKAVVSEGVKSDVVVLEALIENIYGKHRSELTRDEQEQFHQALTGKIAFPNDAIQRDVNVFRARIDEASQKLINEKYREMQMRIDELNDEGKAAIAQLAAEWLDPNYKYEEGQSIPKALMQIHRLQMQINTIEGNKGAYLNRSYQAFTDPKWVEKVKRKPVYQEAVTFVMEQKAQQIKDDADSQIAKAQASISRIRARTSKLESLRDEFNSVDKKLKFRTTKLQQLQQVNTTGMNTAELAAHQRRINTTTKELADFNVESARLTQRISDIASGNFKLDKSETERIAKHEETINKLQLEKELVDQGKHKYLFTRDKAEAALNTWLEGTRGHNNMISFSGLGGTNEGIMKRRKDIPLVLRQVLGEFTDPVYNYANTITQVGAYVAHQQYQMTLRHLLLSMPEIATVGEASGNKVGKFPETAAYSVLNDVFVEPAFLKELQDFGVDKPLMDNAFMKAWTSTSAAVKLGKTIGSPTTQMRNFWSGFLLLAQAGHSPFGEFKDTYELMRYAKNRVNVFTGNLMLGKQEAMLLNQKYIRLGVRRDGASSGELEKIFNDFHQMDTAVREQGLLSQSFSLLVRSYQFSDDFFKIIHFEKGLADLKKTGMSEADAELEAARRTRDTMPTYSMVPRWVRNVRQFPLIGSFVAFPYEQLRTLKNNFAYMAGDVQRYRETGNSQWLMMAGKRAMGLTVGFALPSIAAAASMWMFGIDDEDDDALDYFGSDWRRGQLRLYLGKGENGMNYLDLTSLVPSEYVLRAVRQAFQESDEKGGGFAGAWAGLWEGVSALGKPYYQWDIATQGFKSVFDNYDSSTGRPIYGEGKSLGDLLGEPGKNQQHWGQLFNYVSRQFGPGMVQNLNDFSRALAGTVSETGEAGLFSSLLNEHAAGLGGNISRSGKEFTEADAVAALLGFRVTTQDVNTLGVMASGQTRSKIAAYSAEFKQALDTTVDLSPEFIDSRIEQVLSDRQRAYDKMQDLIHFYKKKNRSESEIADLLYEKDRTLGKEQVRQLVRGQIPQFEPSKELLSRSLTITDKIANPQARLQAKRTLAERYRYVVKRAAEMQRQ